MRIIATLMGTLLYLYLATVLAADWQEESATIKYSRDELHTHWRVRIEGILQSGKIPIIDMESTIHREQLVEYLEGGLLAMDRLGVALIAFDGKQRPRDGSKGYRPSHYTNQLVNAYPDRFIPATNGGTNNNWLREKESFVEYLQEAVYDQPYAIIGELDFRHYMSNYQCKNDRYDRDSDISLLSDNGKAVFELAQETGLPVAIHLEPEDVPLQELEQTLKRYPRARIIVAHFGQLRHPGRQTRFTPAHVRELLERYPNLYYDLAVGHPGRTYRCNNNILDTVLWKRTEAGQSRELDPGWRAILSDYSERFVSATDYGGGRGPLPAYLQAKVGNLRLILSQLPPQAQHNIAYRNAWRLLTGNKWLIPATAEAQSPP